MLTNSIPLVWTLKLYNRHQEWDGCSNSRLFQQEITCLIPVSAVLEVNYETQNLFTSTAIFMRSSFTMAFRACFIGKLTRTKNGVELCDRSHLYYKSIINYDLDITNIFIVSPWVRYIEVFNITNPQFNEQIWPVPSNFVKLRFHCISTIYTLWNSHQINGIKFRNTSSKQRTFFAGWNKLTFLKEDRNILF